MTDWMNGWLPLADLMLGYAISNVVIAAPLALIAYLVQVKREWSFFAHLLWLVVLTKLLTPPFVWIPLALNGPTGATVAGVGSVDATPILFSWKVAAAVIWFAGSTLVLAWSLSCILRFDRLLKASSAPAPTDLQSLAQELTQQLRLKSTPALFMTSANVAPMVWWVGGQARVYLPQAIAAHVDPAALRLIIAHELGHVRRRDHYVRWLEWCVCVCFWWNPLAWWARRNLRVNEELCCDALVIAELIPRAATYARSLVSSLEVLASPTIPVPATASGIDGGRIMERRIKMIVSKETTVLPSRRLRGALVLCAAALLPLGFSVAQDANDLDRVESWLESGVNSAYLTEEQANIMLEALRHNQSRNVSLNQRRATLEFEEFTVELEKEFEQGRIDEREFSRQLARAKAELHNTIEE